MPPGEPRFESFRHCVPSAILRDGGAVLPDRARLEENGEEMATPLHLGSVQVKGLSKAEGGVMQRAGFRRVEQNEESDKPG